MASLKDVASLNITKEILSHYPFISVGEKFHGAPVYALNMEEKEIKLVFWEDEPVYTQNIPEFFPKIELIVFVSRHSSVSGTPTLSVHTPGNFGNADLGGIPGKLSVSPANAMRTALITMKQLVGETLLDYEVSYECTHHGPSLDVPTMFVELGSSQKQWNDLKAAEIVAHAAMDAALKFGEQKAKAVVGIGGPHYNAKFTKIALKEATAFSHIIPKHAIPIVDQKILKQCIEKTFEKVDIVVLDWKGIRGEDKPSLIEKLEKLGLMYNKV
ncbi:MAG: D-aminoacyl-tRNA deacylase [Candidatus Bathyarchaeia archaeon]